MYLVNDNLIDFDPLIDVSRDFKLVDEIYQHLLDYIIENQEKTIIAGGNLKKNLQSRFKHAYKFHYFAHLK